jgi:anti-sigma factor RsiW
MSGTVTCRDEIALLGDYVDGALSPEETARVEAHLAVCPNCTSFLRDYRETPRLFREATAAAMPAELKERLRRVLQGKDPAP